jgi:hypothetical protein
VAKKTRTPAPPRTVQAPQRRSDAKRKRSPEDRKRLLLSIAFAASGVLAVVVAGVIVFTRGNPTSAGGAGRTIDQSQLVGLQTGPAPWNAGVDHLPDRLKPLGLTALPQEALTLHIHQHLDVFVNGKPTTVPVGIGIYDGQFITEIHTHSKGAEGIAGNPNQPSGVIHVESPTKTTYTLGQFFGVWGVRFTPDCVGGYCQELTPWKLYVNGKLHTGDPTKIPLKEHDEYALVIGTPPKSIPSKFQWPSGL